MPAVRVSVLGRGRALRSMWAVAKKETIRSRNFAFRAFRAPFRAFRDPRIFKRGISGHAEWYGITVRNHGI